MTSLFLLLALASTPQAERGRAVFSANCARCHGEGGRGDGPASLFLEPPPVNLASGDFRFRSTLSGCPPTDEDLFRRLTLGIPGTAMPPFASMPAQDRWAVVAYIKEFSAARTPCKVVSTPSPLPPADPERGKALYTKLACATCHGEKAQGGAVKDRVDALGQPVWASNLTQPDSLRGGPRAADLYMRITTGIDGTAMPSYAGSATDEERWQLSQYLVSIQDPNRHEALEPKGRRLLLSMGCAFCHSGVDASGNYDPRYRFGGGQVVEVRPLAAYAPGNLTPAALSTWSDTELTGAITDGEARGRRLDPLAMPWPYYHALSADDVRALVAALRALPSVEPTTVHPEQPSLRERLTTKWSLLRGRQPSLELVIRPPTKAEGGR